MANGSYAKTLGLVNISFTLANQPFTEKFLILPKMNKPILGLPFFERNDILIDLKSRKLLLPDITLQINSVAKANGSKKTIHHKNKFALKSAQKITVQPHSQEVLKCAIDKKFSEEIIGIVEPNAGFEKSSGLCLTSSLSKLKNSETEIALLNVTPIAITVAKDTAIAKFTILTAKQAEYIQPIDPSLFSLDNFQLNELVTIHEKVDPFPKNEFWFPTPETCSSSQNLTGIHKRIFETLVELKQLEKLDPLQSQEEKLKFLSNFNWNKSVLNVEQKSKVEDLLVEFNDIFARHRFDVGGNDEFKIKLTPEKPKPVYTQSPPTPIHLREEILVDLAIMQYFGIITTLPYSKYSSPLFAQRKPSGKLRLLVDLRRVNHLIRHDYNSNNFPISTLEDVGIHLAGKSLFAKLDCSQAYYAVKMADPLSVQLLAFNFASRTFAYTRLAQGLSRSVSAFSSFMRKYLDTCIANDQCFQYVDDLGTAAHNFDELCSNLESIFHCIRRSGLKLSMEKCEIGVPNITFLGRSISSEGTMPNKSKVDKFLSTIKMPKNVKQTKRLIGFFQYFRHYMPKLADKLLPFYQLTKNDTPFEITNEHHTCLKDLTKMLENSCKITLRLPKPDLQYVILADASYYSAGYVLMVEDYVQKGDVEHKLYAPVAFGSKIFNATQLKLSIYAKEFLGVHFAFDTFAHILWGATKPILVLTDNKSLTSFFQAKTIPAALWNAVDHVLNFNFVLGHVPGRANTAADFLSQIHINPSTKLSLKISTKMPIHGVEVEMKPSVPDNSLTALQCYEDDDFQIYDLDVEISEILCDLELNSLAERNPLDEFEFHDDNQPLNLIEEQHKDLNIRIVIDWIQQSKKPDYPYFNDELQKYRKHLHRLLVKNGILYRKFYDHTGKVLRFPSNCVKNYCIGFTIAGSVVI